MLKILLSEDYPLKKKKNVLDKPTFAYFNLDLNITIVLSKLTQALL